MKNNVVEEKSKRLAIRIVKLYKYLTSEHKEFVLSKQILRSGTSIGANVRESIYAQSSADFVSKMSLALKEASETAYWMEILHECDYINFAMFDSLYADLSEIIKLLTSIINTLKSRINQQERRISNKISD